MLLGAGVHPQQQYDAIIIGGGLGGMTCANILGAAGLKVLLCEAHNKLGGLATWFLRRPEHIFDISLHGFPYGMVKTCRRYWGEEISQDIIQLHDVRFSNPQYKIQTNFTKEDFTQHLQTHFQVSPSIVADFFSTLAGISLQKDSRLPLSHLFEKFFPKRPDVHRFLLEPITYANGHTLEDPALSYAIVFGNFMKKGVYAFKGGTDQLIHKMKNCLLQNNVDIKLQTKVEKILLDQDRSTHASKCCVRGIQTAKWTSKAPLVISNANLKSTLFQLVGDASLSSHFSSQYTEKLREVRQNTSSCQVYMGLKPNVKIPFLGDLLFHSNAPEFTTDELLSRKTSSRTFSFYYPETRPHLPFDYTAIVASTNARYSDWEQLAQKNNGYELGKEELIQDTVSALKQYLPDIEKNIHWIEAATPLTIERFTHHPEGTSFGTKFEGLDVSLQLSEEIKGLYHCGSVGIIMSGWLGAANYGVITANKILGQNQFQNQGN